MEILILKTNINSKSDFIPVKDFLRYFYDIKDCSIDLEDIDKVVRITGNNLDLNEVISRVNGLGFQCEELQ